VPTRSAFTRKERFVENYAVTPKPEQLDVRLKLINENWEKYNSIEDELEELGHDSNNQQQCDEMEEICCYLSGFIETKLKKHEPTGPPVLNVTTKPSVKVRLPQLSVLEFSGNLQDWATFKDTFFSVVGDSTTILNIQKFHKLLSAVSGDAERVIQHIPVSERGFRVEW
jgi:hypothetical protein